jgi:hypothetical protein
VAEASLGAGRRVGGQPSSLVTWVPWCAVDCREFKMPWLMMFARVKIRYGCLETPYAPSISFRFSLGGIPDLCHALWKFDNELKMVYYFTSNVVTPSAFIYVGKDKVESACYYGTG